MDPRRITEVATYRQVSFSVRSTTQRLAVSTGQVVDGVTKWRYILKRFDSCGRRLDDPNSFGKFSAFCSNLLNCLLEEHLDLASLMAFARTSFAVREYIASLPLVERIQESQELALPFIRLQQTQTARLHTLRDFQDSLRAVMCSVCRVESQFATLANLLTLQRVCYLCVSRSHLTLPIPTNLAEDMFGLDEATLQNFGINSARAIGRHIRRNHSLMCHSGEECKILSVFEGVFNLQDVIKIAVDIYSLPGRPGLLGLKAHMQKFLVSHTGPGTRQLRPTETNPDVYLTDAISVANVMRAVSMSWQNHAEDARYAVVASMPHQNLSGSLEFGLGCAGCRRNRFHRSGMETAGKSETAFVSWQLLDHVQVCESARMILRGERLRVKEEKDEASNLRHQMNRTWRDIMSVPLHIRAAIHDLEFGTERTPGEFRSRSTQISNMIEQAETEQDFR